MPAVGANLRGEKFHLDRGTTTWFDILREVPLPIWELILRNRKWPVYRKCLVYTCYQDKIESKYAYKAKMRWLITRFHLFRYLFQYFCLLPSTLHCPERCPGTPKWVSRDLFWASNGNCFSQNFVSLHPVMFIHLRDLMRRLNDSLVEVCNGDTQHAQLAWFLNHSTVSQDQKSTI